jgi:hypothetical protein
VIAHENRSAARPQGVEGILRCRRADYDCRLRGSASGTTPKPRPAHRGTPRQANRERTRIVDITEKRPRPAIAALGDMMRKIGNDNAGKSGHEWYANVAIVN